ncbi:MAG: QueT transporter family protein, partial [Lachnospiraceae bacterium]|nr:QueT transporter family protein [Lachnospiraceae bacterium]
PRCLAPWEHGATLLGALGTWLLRKRSRWLAPLPPIAANTLIVPLILAYAYQFEGSLPYFMLTVGLGEIISCGVLGMLLMFTLNKYKGKIFQ